MRRGLRESFRTYGEVAQDAYDQALADARALTIAASPEVTDAMVQRAHDKLRGYAGTGLGNRLAMRAALEAALGGAVKFRITRASQNGEQPPVSGAVQEGNYGERWRKGTPIWAIDADSIEELLALDPEEDVILTHGDPPMITIYDAWK